MVLSGPLDLGSYLVLGLLTPLLLTLSRWLLLLSQLLFNFPIVEWSGPKIEYLRLWVQFVLG
jgi:hypothetical protein